MRDDGPAIDLTGFQRADNSADLLQCFQADIAGGDTFLGGDLRDHVVERRSGLGDAKRPARQFRRRCHTGIEGRVRDQNFLAVDAFFFDQCAADDLDRALIGKVDQPARNSGDAIIDVARSNRHGHRRRGLEEDQFDIEVGVGEIPLLLCHERTGMGRKPQRTQLYFLRSGGHLRAANKHRHHGECGNGQTPYPFSPGHSHPLSGSVNWKPVSPAHN